MTSKQQKTAFTLAEVLITLGIIGVVAALTIPTLMANYRKRVIETSIKRSFSIFQQVFKNAQAEYGDVVNWQTFSRDVSDTNFKKEKKEFVETYILPYLSGATFERKTFAAAGYKEGWLVPNEIWFRTNDSADILTLKSGENIIITANELQTSKGGSGKYGSVFFYIDTNGTAKPNTVGKDIQMFELIIATGELVPKGQITSMWVDTGIPANKITDRDTLLKNCKKSAYFCTALFSYDGWEFKKDYPYIP